MYAYQWKLPLAIFCIAMPAFFIGSYFSGREYRRHPSGMTSGVVVSKDRSDHAKVVARYEVAGRSYQIAGSGDIDAPLGGSVPVYYLAEDPSHATYSKPDWIWWDALLANIVGVGIWALMIHFGLRLQYYCNRHSIDAAMAVSKSPNSICPCIKSK